MPQFLLRKRESTVSTFAWSQAKCSAVGRSLRPRGFTGPRLAIACATTAGWIRVLGSLAGVVDGSRHEELGRRSYYPDSSALAQGQLDQLGFGKHNALWLSLAEFRRNVCVSDLLRPKQASQCMCFACQRRCQKQQRFLRNEQLTVDFS